MATFQIYVLSVVAIANLLIGIYVLYQNHRNITNQSFFIFVSGVAIWIGGFVFLFVLHDFIFDKMIHYGGLLLILGLFIFAQVFPSHNLIGRRWWFIYIPFLFAALFFIPSNLIVEDMIISQSGIPQPIIGPLLPFYAAGWGAYFVASLFLLGRSYIKATGRERLQLNYLFVGMGVFLLITFISDLVLPAVAGISYLNLLGPLSSVVFIGLAAYAIVRHQLMDVKIIIQRGLIFTALFALIVGFYLALVFILGFLFQQVTDATILISAAATTVFGIFTVPMVERRFRRATDHIFFKDTYVYSNALHELSDILSKHIDLEAMLTHTSNALKKHLRVNKVFFLLTNDNTLFDGAKLVTVNIKFPKEYFKERIERPVVLIHEDIPSMLQDPALSDAWRNTLIFSKEQGKKFNVALSVPLIFQNEIVGFFGLGSKRSGDRFVANDILLIQTLASQAAVALQRAKLHQEVKTHSKELETKVVARTQEIHQLQQKQQQMMLDISHGLQTPLTIVKSELEALQKGRPSSDAFTALERSIDETSKFTYDLLRLARLEMADSQLDSTPVNVSVLLDEIVEEVTTLASERSITITTTIEKNVLARGSRDQLHELLINILSNAMKYIGKNKKRIAITLTTGKQKVVISIRDTGIGIPKKDLPHIFDRFHRVQGVHTNEKGTGLGLAISKRIVERHGGSIHVESTLGKGTSFTISLPQVL